MGEILDREEIRVENTSGTVVKLVLHMHSMAPPHSWEGKHLALS